MDKKHLMKRDVLKKIAEFVVLVGVWGILFTFFFSIFQEFRRLQIESDTIAHINGALSLADYLKGGMQDFAEFKATAKYAHLVTYPVWHLLVYGVHFIVQLVTSGVTVETSANIGAAVVNATSIVVTMKVVLHHFVNKVNSGYPFVCKLLIVAGLMFAGPFDASSQLTNYYLGGYTGNIWHNPTYILVRMIGVIVFLMYTEILTNHKAKRKDYVIVSLLLVLSAFCKPNFYQSFIPGLVVVCVIYFLVHRSKAVFFECLKIAGTCVPIAVIAIAQLFIALPEQEGGRIGVGFLYVWKYFTEKWELSLLISIVFPLIVYLVMAFRRKWNMQMILSVAMFGSALLQYMFFYLNAGPFAGDFSWGVGLAIFFCFMTAAEKVAETYDKGGKFAKIINIVCWGIFLLHLFFGVLYFRGIWTRLEVTAPLRYW
ncbi:MAG: hypothetical protein IJX66_06735 [Lachnospiraceae bacterium]|nr:hypothetical protein [Lachnospiraceae bacterium]